MPEDVLELSIARHNGAAPAARCITPHLRVLHHGVKIAGASHARDELQQNRRHVRGRRPSLVLPDPISFAPARGRNAH
jgi:hypothetical protein